MASKDLTKLSDEELEHENQLLMEERAEVEQKVKDKQMVIQAEVTRRADASRVAGLVDTLSDDDKAALRQHLAEEG